ncbi:MAG: hypothetical protein JXD18_11785, partial [Anaerolineae bacterium]|nr:hypothetical protein [Anaerolineae bacterium]
WAQARGRVTAAIDQRSAELQQDVNEAERALQMAYSGGQAQIGRAQSVIQQLGSKVSAAQSAIEGMFSTIDQNVTQLMGQVDAIEWTLDQAAEASFDFYEGEDFVAAVRAKLLESNKDDGPEGILHMTDDRLIFEQKEEVATKKVLFITTAKEMVQKMLFEETVGYVEQISTSQGGFLGHKSGIEIVFSPEARYTRVGLQLIGASNDAWAQLIRRVSSGEIDQERVGAHAQGVVEVSAEAAVEGGAAPAAAAESAATGEEIPTKCPNCGALFTSPIVRGMREIRCDYCGTVVRL